MRMGNLACGLLSLCVLAGAVAARADTPSLTGDWRMGQGVVTIRQNGNTITAVWKQPNGNCQPGAVFWNGHLQGDQITGERETCSKKKGAHSQPLAVKVLGPNRLQLDLGDRSPVLQRLRDE